MQFGRMSLDLYGMKIDIQMILMRLGVQPSLSEGRAKVGHLGVFVCLHM